VISMRRHVPPSRASTLHWGENSGKCEYGERSRRVIAGEKGGDDGGDDGTRTHDPLLANCAGTAWLQGCFRVSAGSGSVEYRRRSPSTARFSSVVARKWHDPTPMSRSRSATRSSGVERHFNHTENLDVTESRSLSYA
jgi:hypothetical protein